MLLNKWRIQESLKLSPSLSLGLCRSRRKRRYSPFCIALLCCQIYSFNLYFCFFFLYFTSKNKKLSHFLQPFFLFMKLLHSVPCCCFSAPTFLFYLTMLLNFIQIPCLYGLSVCYTLFPVKPISRFWYECSYSNKLLPWEPKLKHPTNFNFCLSQCCFICCFISLNCWILRLTCPSELSHASFQVIGQLKACPFSLSLSY